MRVLFFLLYTWGARLAFFSRRILLSVSLLMWSGWVAAALPVDSPSVVSMPVAESEVVMPFKDIGAYYPIRLQGADGNGGLSFGVRLDEVVTAAKIKLNFSYSPSMDFSLTHLKLYFNEELITALPLNKDQSGRPTTQEIPLDPRFFSDFNQLRFQLVGHYQTLTCEDPFHSSLWAEISPASEIVLQTRPLTLANDLALLPAPFFDRRDNRSLTLPFVFPKNNDRATLRVAGILSSWFGALASYRGLEFPARQTLPTKQHAIVFATNTDRPTGLESLPKVDLPTLMVQDNPAAPGKKMLLVLGRDVHDLELAATALVQGSATLSGSRAVVRSIGPTQARKPYDAPNWIQTDRPIRLGDLVENSEALQVRGYNPAPIRINLRVPADLFPWRNNGIPMDLRYHYTPPLRADDSMLNVEINNQFLQSYRLKPTGDVGENSRLVLPVLDGKLFQDSSALRIPAFRVGSNNQLQFQFQIPPKKTGACTSAPTPPSAAIDPLSTIDFTGLPHFAALPNLAFFANSGFPFTRYADLSDTALLIPDHPNAAEQSAVLSVLGVLGRHTGLAATRFALLSPAEVQKGRGRDRHWLVIGTGSVSTLLADWQGPLPLWIQQQKREFSALERVQSWLGAHFAGDDDIVPHLEQGRVRLESEGALGALIGFESPFLAGRSVVVISAAQPEGLERVVEALSDPAKITAIRGDVSIMRLDTVQSFRVGGVYYVGELEWWQRLWFFMSRYPLALAVLGGLTGLCFALMLFRWLSRVATRRLGG